MSNKDNLHLQVALVQSPIKWEDPQDNRSFFGQKIDQVKEKVDLIILPEMFSTGFTMSPENIHEKEGDITLQWMQRMAQKRDCAVTGSMVYKEENHYYNRLFFVFPNGHYESYDKRHTFTLAGEHKKYTKGTKKCIVEYKGFKICPLICYDLRFPVWSRNTEDVDLLLYVANWPAPRINAWDALLKARAIENMVYCIGVNRVGKDYEGHLYTGHSGIYDPLGERIGFSEKDETLVRTLDKAILNKYREKLRFLEDRDIFTIH
ncbi:Carbon-nitrogen hydrolase [Maribacter sedimenticola]|uniref:Carbon-nitrogen hydrolase n=1 Tax=Maribacter sedimenticola TaxID=228956 RepID=A0ABY1SIU7_9FLAO|nr:amidohydrolase [Maribacter sedimenticola]SNR57158.1 Carbon-nitrogen hydrolase [Maribacter sedimenticola]